MKESWHVDLQNYIFGKSWIGPGIYGKGKNVYSLQTDEQMDANKK